MEGVCVDWPCLFVVGPFLLLGSRKPVHILVQKGYPGAGSVKCLRVKDPYEVAQVVQSCLSAFGAVLCGQRWTNTDKSE